MSVLCKMGLHGRLVSGLGGMGDAIICLRCGREKYEEDWMPWDTVRAVAVSIDNQDQVSEARQLPGVILTAVARPDPEFDAWLKSDPHILPDSVDNKT